MTSASIETSTLDPDGLMLVRNAALVAVDAPPASYLLNLGAAGEIGVGAEDVQGVLAAVAPIVGTPKVVSAAGKIARARPRPRPRGTRGRAGKKRFELGGRRPLPGRAPRKRKSRRTDDTLRS